MDAFETLLELALAEDLGDAGDVTSRAIFDAQETEAVLFAKESGVLAGSRYFERTYARVDPAVSVRFVVAEGDELSPGDRVAEVSGPVLAVLEGERTAINFLSFLSGIATETRRCVRAAAETGRAVILDTRKTLPGYRGLSKYAVSVGGARNHRMGLYDMVMIKDNHIDAAGSIAVAVERARARWNDAYRVEVECRNLEETEQAVAAGADIVMLDNMDEALTAEAVAAGKGKVLFEASGNMDAGKIARYSALGVDFISVGRLTHSVRAFDFSLRMKRRG